MTDTKLRQGLGFKLLTVGMAWALVGTIIALEYPVVGFAVVLAGSIQGLVGIPFLLNPGGAFR